MLVIGFKTPYMKLINMGYSDLLSSERNQNCTLMLLQAYCDGEARSIHDIIQCLLARKFFYCYKESACKQEVLFHCLRPSNLQENQISWCWRPPSEYNHLAIGIVFSLDAITRFPISLMLQSHIQNCIDCNREEFTKHVAGYIWTSTMWEQNKKASELVLAEKILQKTEKSNYYTAPDIAHRIVHLIKFEKEGRAIQCLSEYDSDKQHNVLIMQKDFSLQNTIILTLPYGRSRRALEQLLYKYIEHFMMKCFLFFFEGWEMHATVDACNSVYYHWKGLGYHGNTETEYSTSTNSEDDTDSLSSTEAIYSTFERRFSYDDHIEKNLKNEPVTIPAKIEQFDTWSQNFLQNRLTRSAYNQVKDNLRHFFL